MLVMESGLDIYCARFALRSGSVRHDASLPRLFRRRQCVTAEEKVVVDVLGDRHLGEEPEAGGRVYRENECAKKSNT